MHRYSYIVCIPSPGLICLCGKYVLLAAHHRYISFGITGRRRPRTYPNEGYMPSIRSPLNTISSVKTRTNKLSPTDSNVRHRPSIGQGSLSSQGDRNRPPFDVETLRVTDTSYRSIGVRYIYSLVISMLLCVVRGSPLWGVGKEPNPATTFSSIECVTFLAMTVTRCTLHTPQRPEPALVFMATRTCYRNGQALIM
ncbi:uncharacterized protein EI90DRAFT_1685008 [Cantharellus anzutake]|uniref:uncharacterized protein n=1 Tax=Cantharellus anzutake TaxID=1750568 RepID=UPI001904B960|nr:uncharacterized protein EI90DRAFT_1685008 [Cantharellus anzutake]KAF8327807.1 hypothetical protein EI90DRAFT_1685008 [Cantharellus anzutake]